MRKQLSILILACGLALFAVSCKQKSEVSTSAPETPGAQAPAGAAAPTTAPAATTPATEAETTAKLAGVDWALRQDEIKNDPQGQWAILATASSAYSQATGTAPYSANQAVGPPNVQAYADDSNAWTPADTDLGIEWLDLKFPKPVHATEARIRESYGSGAVVKVELFDEAGNAHTVWSGNDPTKELNYLIVKFPRTEYKTDRVKVTLATNVVPGWNEIDAVQLVGTEN